ncbi:hypothetical protein OG709_29920 [Streptomyces sp. NBC_01267]|uniref:hypothetical protein n=1 Tax=Streptomyces sp. NBC_01267 TaxID=2903805 RepID=UPI002E3529F2|nr:hypothetical protein [Streptomyces sp. NBC_01267]
MSRKDVDIRPEMGLPDVDVDSLPSIQLEELAGESEAELVARGVAYVREFEDIRNKPTILLRNIAAVTVALRLKYDDPGGKSYGYRQAVAGMYRTAGIPADSESGTPAAVRWHAGNLLRKTLTTRELRATGLLETSPSERESDRRALNGAIIKSSRASDEVATSTPRVSKGKGKSTQSAEVVPEQRGHPVKATADHLRLARTVGTVLGQLDTDVIDRHMTDGQRAALDAELADMQAKLTKLRRHSRKRRSKD